MMRKKQINYVPTLQAWQFIIADGGPRFSVVGVNRIRDWKPAEDMELHSCGNHWQIFNTEGLSRAHETAPGNYLDQMLETTHACNFSNTQTRGPDGDSAKHRMK